MASRLPGHRDDAEQVRAPPPSSAVCVGWISADCGCGVHAPVRLTASAASAVRRGAVRTVLRFAWCRAPHFHAHRTSTLTAARSMRDDRLPLRTASPEGETAPGRRSPARVGRPRATAAGRRWWVPNTFSPCGPSCNASAGRSAGSVTGRWAVASAPARAATEPSPPAAGPAREYAGPHWSPGATSAARARSHPRPSAAGTPPGRLQSVMRRVSAGLAPTARDIRMREISPRARDFYV